jgi:hypothetical protein
MDRRTFVSMWGRGRGLHDLSQHLSDSPGNGR